MSYVFAAPAVILCSLTTVSGGGVPAASAPATRPAPPAATQPSLPLQTCADLMLRSVEHAEGLLPQMAVAADAVAKRWIAGADIFVSGDDSFIDEAFYRAGGLIGLRRIARFKQNYNGTTMPWDEVPEESVVLYGLHRNADPTVLLFDELPHLGGEKDTVVFFGSKDWLVSQRIVKYLQKRLPGKFFFIDTDLPPDTRLRTAGGVVYGDCAPMATAVHLWTFTAELVAACTRQGKMPGIWPSGAIPKYEVWEKKYQKIRFHDDFTIGPIGAGTLGRQYLGILRGQLEAVANSAEQVKAAAGLLRSVPPDKAVYVMVESHLLAGEAYLPAELPNWLVVQRGWRWHRATATLESGDGVLWLGYLDWPEREIRRAIQQKNVFAAVSVRGPGQDVAGGASVVWIPAPWVYPDAVVEIPDYPLKACPTSGIIQGTLLWGLVGEVTADRMTR
jgi:hypothetical protein